MERQGDSRRGKDGDALPGAPDESTRNPLHTIDCPNGSACTAFRCLFSHEARAENQEPDLFNRRYNSAQSQTTHKPSYSDVRSVSPASSPSPDVSTAPGLAQGPMGTPKDISTSLLSIQDKDSSGLVNPAANDHSTLRKEHVKIDNPSRPPVLPPASARLPPISPKNSRIVLPPISRLLEKQAEVPIIPSPLPPLPLPFDEGVDNGVSSHDEGFPRPSTMPRYPSVLSAHLPLPAKHIIHNPKPQSEVHKHATSGELHPQSSHHPAEDQPSRTPLKALGRWGNHQFRLNDFNAHRPLVRKYQCTKCDKSFSLSKDLERHYMSIHATDSDLYRCRCNYSSYRKDQMKVHIKSRKCESASSEGVCTCICKVFETSSVVEYLDHIENCHQKRRGRPRKCSSPERDEEKGNHKYAQTKPTRDWIRSNIPLPPSSDKFAVFLDQYRYQSAASDTDSLKRKFNYNMTQNDETPLSGVAPQSAEQLPPDITSSVSLSSPYFIQDRASKDENQDTLATGDVTPWDPGYYLPGSPKAKDSRALQANGRQSICMFCKQGCGGDIDLEGLASVSCRKCGEHAHYSCATNPPYNSDTINSGDRDIIISSNFDMDSDVDFLNMFPEPEISPRNWTCPNCAEDASGSDENEKRRLENSASPEPWTKEAEHAFTTMSNALREGSDPAKATVSDMRPPIWRNPFLKTTADNQVNRNAGQIDAHQLPVSDEKPGSSTVGDFVNKFSIDYGASASADIGQARHGDLARAIEAATDSGYGSQLATGSQKGLIESHAVDAQYETDAGFDGTATEYSDTSSVATWKKESYIEEFVDDLVARVRELQPDEETLDRISALLPDLLKAFALRVGYNAPSRMHRDVMYFIHKYRGMISSNFKEKSLHRGDDTSDGTPLPSEGDRIPLQDLMKSWFSSLSNVEIRPENESRDPIIRSDDSDLESQASAHTDTSQDVTEGDNDAWLRSYREFIRNSEVFQWLLGRLYVESSLVATEPRAMEAIRAKIISSLRPSQRISRNASSECFNASFCVGWDPSGFLQSQEYGLKAAEVTSRIITLTGSENDAQALTCSQYLSQTWPTTGSLTFKVIKAVLHNDPNNLQHYTYPDGTTLDATLHDSVFTAQVTGVAPHCVLKS